MIKHLFLAVQLSKINEVKWFQVLLCITNNSFKYQSFVYIQLNDQTVLFLTFQVFRCTHFQCKTFLFDPLIGRYQVLQLPEWTWKRRQWKGTLHSPTLQHYWSLIIRLYNVIIRTIVQGVLLFFRDAVGVFYTSSWRGCSIRNICISVLPNPSVRAGCNTRTIFK